MYTLCIIDMQDYFLEPCNEKPTDNVAREIRQAIKDDAPIVLVEYRGCGETTSQLLDVIKHAGATKVYKVVKVRDDGSEEIIECLHKNNLPEDHIKITGVNTDCCVYATCYGIQRKRPLSKIEVIADACQSNWLPDGHSSGINRLKALGCTITNGEIIPQTYPPDLVKSIGDPF